MRKTIALILMIGASPLGAVTYYVSPTGLDANSGTGTGVALLTIQRAADLVKPGDSVLVMNGTYTNSCPKCDVVTITRSGSAAAWIHFKAYPGHRPRLSFNGWHGFKFQGSASYIEVNGFEIQGNNPSVTLAAALAQSTSSPDPTYNGNGISADGRDSGADKPHHLRFLNNKVHDCGGGGISAIQSDYIHVEGNEVYDNCWYTIYATSGISFYQPWRYDTHTSGYKMSVLGNKVYNNRCMVPWVATGKLSDGNGIIIDDTKNTQNKSLLGAYTGKFLVSNNLSFGNGGSGIHSYLGENVDIVNNVAYHNGQVMNDYGEIFANDSNRVTIANNIACARPAGVVNSNWNNTSVTYDYNIYHNSTVTAVIGPNDLVVDPQFMNPTTTAATADFRLKAASAAIDSGLASVAPSYDHVHAPRPQGAGVDRGAYERSLLATVKPGANTTKTTPSKGTVQP